MGGKVWNGKYRYDNIRIMGFSMKHTVSQYATHYEYTVG